MHKYTKLLRVRSRQGRWRCCLPPGRWPHTSTPQASQLCSLDLLRASARMQSVLKAQRAGVHKRAVLPQAQTGGSGGAAACRRVIGGQARCGCLHGHPQPSWFTLSMLKPGRSFHTAAGTACGCAITKTCHAPMRQVQCGESLLCGSLEWTGKKMVQGSPGRPQTGRAVRSLCRQDAPGAPPGTPASWPRPYKCGGTAGRQATRDPVTTHRMFTHGSLSGSASLALGLATPLLLDFSSVIAPDGTWPQYHRPKKQWNNVAEGQQNQQGKPAL